MVGLSYNGSQTDSGLHAKVDAIDIEVLCEHSILRSLLVKGSEILSRLTKVLSVRALATAIRLVE